MFSKVARALTAALAVAALLTSQALAQNAPYNNPTYLPPIVADTQSSTAATSDTLVFTPYGISGGAIRIIYSGSSLTAALQGSNDGTSWTTLPIAPVAGGATVTSITASGFWTFNATGLTNVRLHVTANSGGAHSITAKFSGSFSPNALTLLNPQAVTGPIALIDGVGGVNQAEVTSAHAQTVNLGQVAGATVAQGHGTAATGIRFELPTDGTGQSYLASLYPNGATPLTASATGTTGATTATLAGTSGKTTYICGFSIMTSANAAVVVAPTVTGTITGTLTMSQYVSVNTAGVSEIKRDFNRCVPASATNTGIAVISGAAGTGGVTAVNAWGFQQ